MKELNEQFTGVGEVRGWTFTQLEKCANSYIYERRRGDLVYWEVFKRKINTQFNCVSYPSSKSFGKWAWCFGDKNKAYLKLEEINDN